MCFRAEIIVVAVNLMPCTLMVSKGPKLHAVIPGSWTAGNIVQCNTNLVMYAKQREGD